MSENTKILGVKSMRKFGQNAILTLIPLICSMLGYFAVQAIEANKRLLILEQRLLDISSQRIYAIEKTIALHDLKLEAFCDSENSRY